MAGAVPPTCVGLGSDVLRVNPDLRTVRSPYADGEELVAMPALSLDVALVHLHRGDQGGNGQYLNIDPYFDDLMCMAAARRFMSVERIVDTDDFLKEGPPQSLRINRLMTDGIVETPRGRALHRMRTGLSPRRGIPARVHRERHRRRPLAAHADLAGVALALLRFRRTLD